METNCTAWQTNVFCWLNKEFKKKITKEQVSELMIFFQKQAERIPFCIWPNVANSYEKFSKLQAGKLSYDPMMTSIAKNDFQRTKISFNGNFPIKCFYPYVRSKIVDNEYCDFASVEDGVHNQIFEEDICTREDYLLTEDYINLYRR